MSSAIYTILANAPFEQEWAGVVFSAGATFDGNIGTLISRITWTLAEPTQVLLAGGTTGLTLTGITTALNLPSNLPPASSPRPTVSYYRQASGAVAATSTTQIGVTIGTSPFTGVPSATSTSPASTTSQSETQSSPTPSQSNQPQVIAGSSGGNDAGKLAGAAVGCLVAGALLGFLLTFFFYYRRLRKNGYQSTPSSKEATQSSEYSDAIYLGKVENAWQNHLPQSESDSTIRRLANNLFDQIELHVENFYHDLSRTPVDKNNWRTDNGADSELIAPSAMHALTSTNKATAVIKYIIARAVISKIDYTSAESASLLPRDFTTLHLRPDAQNVPAFDQAWSQWRLLTAYLRQNIGSDPDFGADRALTVAITASKICSAIDPWATDNSTTRQQGLEGILKRASDLGVLLFSQPTTFRWFWGNMNPHKTRDWNTLPKSIVVMPGLEKTTNPDGKPLGLPLRLTEPRSANWRTG